MPAFGGPRIAKYSTICSSALGAGAVAGVRHLWTFSYIFVDWLNDLCREGLKRFHLSTRMPEVRAVCLSSERSLLSFP